MQKVLGVLAGEGLDPEVLRRWVDTADRVLAADGGADRMLAVGRRPHRVVGDLDSISAQAQQNGLDIQADPDQSTTDCDKLLALAESEGASRVTLACVEGGFVDHLLATFSSAVRTDLQVRFAFDLGVGEIVKNVDQVGWEVPNGRRVSLMPITCCTDVHLSGVQWPLDGVLLEPGGAVSISNRALGGAVSVRVGSGAALLFVEVPNAEMPLW